MWFNIKWSNIHVIEIPERRGDAEKIFKEMKVETFPNFDESYTSTDLKSSVNPKKDKRTP